MATLTLKVPISAWRSGYDMAWLHNDARRRRNDALHRYPWMVTRSIGWVEDSTGRKVVVHSKV